MTDHSMLMRAAAEHDIHHVPLGAAVAYIEANMEPEKAEEAVSLLHAAICPTYSARRQREAVLPAMVDEPEHEPEPHHVEEQPEHEPELDLKPKATRKPRSKPVAEKG
jgi:hypothetical protein